MPRLRQYADRDAMADFMGELNAQRARFGYDTQRSLAPVLGVCQATAGNYIRNPETIPFGVLRAIVKAVKPDPGILLKALGYTTQDIKKLATQARMYGRMTLISSTRLRMLIFPYRRRTFRRTQHPPGTP